MKYRNLFLSATLLFVPNLVFGACSTNNLTRCLDSVCAINIGANTAARCQYCGTANAGSPSTTSATSISGGTLAMKNITAGNAAKYTISDKELKKAPSDPGQRYVWARERCLEKVKGCTDDDAKETYNPLIEQSCVAAGINAGITALANKAKETKTEKTCSTEITSCIIDEKHCLADYTNCESDADFDKHFSQCILDSIGCDTFTSAIRSTVLSKRDTTFKNSELALKNMVASYQNARKQRLAGTEQACSDGSAKQKCIKQVCSRNMRHQCSEGFEYEEQMATTLCEYHDVACERLKHVFTYSDLLLIQQFGPKTIKQPNTQIPIRGIN